jgi:hypothetical protein
VHFIKAIGSQSKSLRKIPHVVLGSDRAVVTAGLNIKFGLQIEYLCKIPRFIVQTGGGRRSRGGKGEALAEPCLKMVKKGGEGASAEGSTKLEIEALRSRLDKMENMIQEQSKELKAEVISSQQSMKVDIKEQMDDVSRGF